MYTHQSHVVVYAASESKSFGKNNSHSVVFRFQIAIHDFFIVHKIIVCCIFQCSAYYALFSRSGFDEKVQAEAEANNSIQLFDLPQIVNYK